jgi:hypothetical protein
MKIHLYVLINLLCSFYCINHERSLNKKIIKVQIIGLIMTYIKVDGI